MRIGYVRCSLADDRQTLDHQIDALTAVGGRSAPYLSESCLRCHDDRPGLKACLKFLKSGGQLFCLHLDRIGRSLPHLLKTVENLRARGAILISLGESIDTSSASGELTANLFMSLAQYERALMRPPTFIQRGLESGRHRTLPMSAFQALRSPPSGLHNRQASTSRAFRADDGGCSRRAKLPA